jgi:beta-lactamase regulating signal transducer with metallopeptidase domain/Flp pilus assembly protein TadD
MIAHLWACTWVALAALAATAMLHRQRAAWRHAILLAAMLRFAIPTGWLADSGRLLVKVAPVRVTENLEWLLRSPGGAPMAGSAPKRATFPWMPAIWAAGMALCFGAWARRARLTIRAVRPPDDRELATFHNAAGPEDTELLIVAEDVVPGAWGWWRPRVLLPDGLSAQLTEAELEAVLVHEFAHLRRRDNLTAALARTVASIFWFHPLVWWMENRMLAERETACDELVLARGSRAEDYVSAISKVCRMSFAGAQGYAGVTGWNLKTRMEFIMSVDLNRRSSRVARALPALFIAAIVMLPVAGGYLRAQSQASTERFQDGVKLLGEKKYDEAAQAFREASQLDPTNTRGLMGQVEVLTAQSQYDKALAMLQAEVGRNPNPGLLMNLGNLMVRARHYDDALNVYAKLEPSADLSTRIGETYRRKGDLDSAIANLRQAVKMAPDNVVARSTLALVLDAAGKKPEAQMEYFEVIRLNPNNGVSLNNLAYLLASNGGDLDEALLLAQRGHKALPDSDEVSDTLAWIYLKKEQPDEALPILNELVQKQPGSAEYHEHLAMALQAKGDEFAAAEQRRTAERLRAK